MALLLNVTPDPHDTLAPSAWIERWTSHLAVGARVLDVACGRGRHVRWLAARGADVTGIDRDAQALAPLHSIGRMLHRDLESQPWPLPDEHFDAVIVTNYLWRPLWPALRGAVAPNGVLVIETFGHLQPRFGRPTNPAFLLQPLELIDAVQGLTVLAYEDRVLDNPRRHVQRVAALQNTSKRFGFEVGVGAVD